MAFLWFFHRQRHCFWAGMEVAEDRPIHAASSIGGAVSHGLDGGFQEFENPKASHGWKRCLQPIDGKG